MNKSFSKIRHISESNQKLEKSFLSGKMNLTENRLNFDLKKILSEVDKKTNTMADVMSLQHDILSYERYVAKTASFVYDKPFTCEPIIITNFNLGVNLCKISGSTLCPNSNKICDQKQLVDGVYGPKTKEAYLKYKDKPGFTGETDSTDFDKVVSGQEIPVTSDQIKAFQLFVWNMTSDACNTNCVNDGTGNCQYKTILCGGNCCYRKQAVDGIWGVNTKKAWSQFKDKYLLTNSTQTSLTMVAYELGYDIKKL